jgi:hypothetical protein
MAPAPPESDTAGGTIRSPAVNFQSSWPGDPEFGPVGSAVDSCGGTTDFGVGAVRGGGSRSLIIKSVVVRLSPARSQPNGVGFLALSRRLSSDTVVLHS